MSPSNATATQTMYLIPVFGAGMEAHWLLPCFHLLIHRQEGLMSLLKLVKQHARTVGAQNIQNPC